MGMGENEPRRRGERGGSGVGESPSLPVARTLIRPIIELQYITLFSALPRANLDDTTGKEEAESERYRVRALQATALIYLWRVWA